MALLEIKVEGGLSEEVAFEFISEGEERVSQPCKGSRIRRTAG